jgi:DNA-binding transcriptional regulator YiaG
MTNHPARNKRAAQRGPHPSPAEITQAREAAEHTQAEAAACILVSVRTWQDYEQGRRKMAPALWEYYCLQVAYPQEMRRLIRRWRTDNPLAD